MPKSAIKVKSGPLASTLEDRPEIPTTFEMMNGRFASMIRRMSRRFAWDEDSFEELNQEGNLALVEAHSLFDSKRGARFATFVHQRVRSRMLHWRRSQRLAISVINPVIRDRLRSLDEAVELEEEGTSTLHDLVAGEVDPSSHRAHLNALRSIVQNAMTRIPQRQAEALRLRFWVDLQPSEIAERLGVSRPRATVLVQAGLSNLRGGTVVLG